MEGIKRLIAASAFLRTAGLTSDDHVSLLGMGHNHLIYLVESSSGKFVFRLRIDTVGEATAVDAYSEYEHMRLMHENGAAPRPLMVDATCRILPTSCVVVEYVEGHVLSAVDYRSDHTFVPRLANLTRDMHELPIQSALVPHDDWAELANRVNSLRTHAVRAEVLQLIDVAFAKVQRIVPRAAQVAKVPTHGNIWANNVVVNARGFHLIDFESLALRDPAIEIAHIWTDFDDGSGFTQAEAEEFLWVYTDGRPDRKLFARCEALRRFEALSAIVRRVQHVLRMRRGQFSTFYLERTNIVSKAENVTRYVSRAIAMDVLPTRYETMNIVEMLLE